MFINIALNEDKWVAYATTKIKIMSLCVLGVLDMRFQLSEQPSYGEWTIKTKAWVNINK